MTAILGLNAFHPDSSACLLIDGKLVGAVAEERLGPREKHSGRFPENAIRWLLDDAGLRLRDVTHVAVAREPGANLRAKARYMFSNPAIGMRAGRKFLSRQRDTRKTLNDLSTICGEDPAKTSYKVHAIEHHLAHIASAYYMSPYESLTAGFSYDGSGDFASMMAARCEGSKIDVIDRVALPASLGHFYTAICQFIGFDHFGEEYKVMGLNPYGQDLYSEVMSEVVRVEGERWFNLDPRFFNIANGFDNAEVTDAGLTRLGTIYSDTLSDRLGPPRKRGEPITQREMDIARSTQVRFEQAASNCMKSLQKLVDTPRLAMAGGCGLNGVMNARIQRETAFRDCYHQSASSDDGICIGAAYHCWHTLLGKSERFEMRHSFWGPEYSHDRIREAVVASGMPFNEAPDEDAVIASTADHIAAGAIVGWYQGRSEWGPRALGNRSILANPAIADMKNTINRKIKKRESFRPFAPSVLKEEVGRFFEQDIDSPFMMHVVKFKPEWRETFPAVTHVDGSGRLQSVEPENNPRYYKLISALKDRTGYGIVLNTSFNENEPVVDTPEQAIACFNRTDMDILVLGRFTMMKPLQGENNSSCASNHA